MEAGGEGGGGLTHPFDRLREDGSGREDCVKRKHKERKGPSGTCRLVISENGIDLFSKGMGGVRSGKTGRGEKRVYDLGRREQGGVLGEITSRSKKDRKKRLH